MSVRIAHVPISPVCSIDENSNPLPLEWSDNYSLSISCLATPKYAPRTQSNAENADLTIYFAVDDNSAGQKLTHKYARDNFFLFKMPSLPIELRIDTSHDTPTAQQSRRFLRELAASFETALFKFIEAHPLGKVKMPSIKLNIAGNRESKFLDKGWTFVHLERFILLCFISVGMCLNVTHVRTGGQSGADMAGAIAACFSGVDTFILMPNGYIQEKPCGNGKKDQIIRHTALDIENMVIAGVERLKLFII